MKHLEIKISNSKSTSVELPGDWSELSKKQLLYIAYNWQAWQLMLRTEIDMQFAKAKLFTVLITGKSKRELRAILQLLSKTDFYEIDFNPLSLVNFVFQRNDLTVNRLKEIRTGFFKKLYGPDDKLSNISINEFSFALNFLNQYKVKGEEKSLNLFVACLYRPTHKDWKVTGDRRKPFVPGTISQHLKQVEKMPYEYKQAVLLFFNGCMTFYEQVFPQVFSRSEEQQGSNQTFLDVILGISGGKFGNFDQTKDQNAFLFLKEMNNLLIENAKTKK